MKTDPETILLTLPAPRWSTPCSSLVPSGKRFVEPDLDPLDQRPGAPRKLAVQRPDSARARSQIVSEKLKKSGEHRIILFGCTQRCPCAVAGAGSFHLGRASPPHPIGRGRTGAVKINLPRSLRAGQGLQARAQESEPSSDDSDRASGAPPSLERASGVRALTSTLSARASRRTPLLSRRW